MSAPQDYYTYYLPTYNLTPLLRFSPAAVVALAVASRGEERKL